MDCRNIGSWPIRYTAIIESATIRFGCSGHEFGRRIGLTLTNGNAAARSETGNRLGVFIQYWLQCDVCLEMYHHIHLKVPRTVPHTATGSPYN